MFGIILCVDTFNDCHHECPCFLQKKIHRFSLGLRSFANIEFIDDFKNMKGMNTPKGQ